ncbi:MAG: MarR family transcriptional regulator [Patescibacteria group bacterium]|nr:MarR family transcriptional regulator [Patescibacteria group bacterium]MDE1965796.1 MarR family transcriptional regulator [Patescibacteria group bacterium]
MARRERTKLLEELRPMLFGMRRLMRSRLSPGPSQHDPHVWLRLEVLFYIAKMNAPTMHDIARQFEITPPSATTLIRHLLKEGLVERTRGKSDKRVVRITVTGKGATTLAAKARLAALVIRNVTRDLSEAEIASLTRLLRKVHAANETFAKPHKPCREA